MIRLAAGYSHLQEFTVVNIIVIVGYKDGHNAKSNTCIKHQIKQK